MMRLQVVLLAGLDEDAVKELLKGVHHGGQHLHRLLKFLTVRTETDNDKGSVERSGITAIGGAYNAELDGAFSGADGYIPLICISPAPQANQELRLTTPSSDLGV